MEQYKKSHIRDILPKGSILRVGYILLQDQQLLLTDRPCYIQSCALEPSPAKEGARTCGNWDRKLRALSEMSLIKPVYDTHVSKQYMVPRTYRVRW
jgi:hypothetical protein